MGDHINVTFISSSNDKVDDIGISDELTVLHSKGIPKRLWMGKCVVLHRGDEVPMAKGICHNVSSNIVVGSTCSLRDSHVVDLLQSVHRRHTR